MNKIQILFLEHPLFSKISINTPSTESLELPSDACFAYIVKGDNQVFSEKENINAAKGEFILSLCGFTLGRMLSELSQGYIQTIIVHLNPNLLQSVFENKKPELWKEIESPVTQFVVQDSANNLIKSYFDNINQLFSNELALTENFLKLKLKELIVLLLQTENSENIRKVINSLFSDRVFTFKQLVDAHIDTIDTIDNLAILTNNSLSSFKRKFKEVYQTTPAKYKISRNTEKVAELLRISDKSVSEIGYECGFNSPSHLSKVFKEKFGMPPSQYKLSLSDK